MPSPRINPPQMLARWQSWAFLMTLFLVPFFIKIPLSMRRHPAISVLGDRLHIVLLGAITMLLYWRGPLRGRLLGSAVAAAGVGGAIELIQTLVGRSALWHDFILDLQGIILVVGFILWRGYGKIVGLLLIGALILLISWQISFLPELLTATSESRASFPLLTDFNSPYAPVLWTAVDNSKMEFPSTTSGVLLLTGGPPSRWPGARMNHFPHDWTAHQELLVDARLVNSSIDSTRFGLRLDDFQGVLAKEGGVTDVFWVGRQWQTLHMPIIDRQLRYGDRWLDLTDVDKILLFLPSPKDTVQIEFDNLRLR